MKNYTLLGTIILALSGVLAWKFAESGQLKQRIANLEEEVSIFKAAKTLVVEAAKTPANQEVAQTPDKPAAAEPPADKPKEENSMAKAMSKMFEDKGTREVMKEQMKTMVEGMNKELFDLLGLDPESQAKLSELLVEEQSKNQAVGIKMMTGTKEEKTAVFKEMAANHDVSEAAIKDLIKDPAKIKQYDQYKDSAPERQQLTGVKNKLAGEGAPLSETQEQSLMNLLYTQRKATKWDKDYSKQQNLSPEFFTEAALARQGEQQAAYDAAIDAKLPDVLAPAQVEVYKAQRKTQRAMEQMGVQFMKAMFSEEK
jgi:hypothetical protein